MGGLEWAVIIFLFPLIGLHIDLANGDLALVMVLCLNSLCVQKQTLIIGDNELNNSMYRHNIGLIRGLHRWSETLRGIHIELDSSYMIRVLFFLCLTISGEKGEKVGQLSEQKAIKLSLVSITTPTKVNEIKLAFQIESEYHLEWSSLNSEGMIKALKLIWLFFRQLKFSWYPFDYLWSKSWW